MSNFVVLKTFSSAIEAEMLRGRLEADGVRCTLQGDKAASVVGDVNRLNTNWSNLLGGTTLSVHESDMTHARSVARNRKHPSASEAQGYTSYARYTNCFRCQCFFSVAVLCFYAIRRIINFSRVDCNFDISMEVRRISEFST